MTTSEGFRPDYDITQPPTEAYVFARMADGWAPVARLVVRMIREGWPQADLVYGRGWKARQDAFALDPLHLPLGDAVQPVTPMFGAMLDATPDRWGSRLLDDRFRGILERELALHGKDDFRHRRLPSTLDQLLLGGDDRAGCLAFGPTPKRPLLYPAVVPIRDLAVIEDAMVRFDAGEEIDRPTALLAAGTSLGGARPKCTVRLPNGSLWLAKFRRQGEEFDAVRLEHATMTLAARAGVAAAETRIVPLGKREALLVRRFDRDGDDRRHPYLSALSLSGRRDTDPGGSYAEIADNMRLAGCPSEDIRELFRRMAFNVACGNTDDHLKNHGFIRAATEWRLSEAFDILPTIGGEDYQAIGVGHLGSTSSRANVLGQHGRFGLSADEAAAIVDQVAAAMRDWRTQFTASGVSDADIRRAEPRIADLGAPAAAKVPGGVKR